MRARGKKPIMPAKIAAATPRCARAAPAPANCQRHHIQEASGGLLLRAGHKMSKKCRKMFGGFTENHYICSVNKKNNL